jgi:hypothetical protein
LLSRGLDEHEARSRESVRTRLANQGIEAGSQAFDAEMRALESGLGDARARAELDARGVARADRQQMGDELATGAGYAAQERADLLGRLSQGAGLSGLENTDELQRLFGGFDQYTGARGQQFGELMGERQQRVGEGESDFNRDYAAALAERQTPISEITSLISANPLTTLNPGAIRTANVSPTDVLGANQLGYNAQLANYQQQQQNRNSLLGAGATALAAIFASDRRLKKDLAFVGTDDQGREWWDYRLTTDADDAPLRRGVIAQDLLETEDAGAVLIGEDGYLAVDYAEL